jgi:hypothetical protein
MPESFRTGALLHSAEAQEGEANEEWAAAGDELLHVPEVRELLRRKP